MVKGVSREARDWARQVKGITPAEGVVLRELAEWHHPTRGVLLPSVDKLLERAHGITERTARRALNSLEDQGIIRRLNKGNKYQRTQYVLIQSTPDILTSINEKYTGHSDKVHRTFTTSTPDILTGSNKEVSSIKQHIGTSSEPGVLDFYDELLQAYEQNIAIITPMVSDEMKAFIEDKMPAEWGPWAVGEAVSNNARSWAYIRAILRRWLKDGPGLNGKSGSGAGKQGGKNGEGEFLRSIEKQSRQG